VSDDNNQENKKPGLFTMGWFKPLYRRVIVVVVIAAWSTFEWFINQNPDHQFWGALTLAALAYGIWTFFINFENELKKTDGKPKS
jgi:hypothetical protein